MKTRLLREAKEGFMEQRQHLSPYHSVSSPSIALWTLLLSQSHKVHSINSILWTKKPRFKKPLLVKIHWGTLLRCYFLNLAEGSFSFKGLLIHFSGDRTGLNGYMRQYMQGPSMNSHWAQCKYSMLKRVNRVLPVTRFQEWLLLWVLHNSQMSNHSPWLPGTDGMVSPLSPHHDRWPQSLEGSSRGSGLMQCLLITQEAFSK